MPIIVLFALYLLKNKIYVVNLKHKQAVSLLYIKVQAHLPWQVRLYFDIDT